jgi:gamma-glutamyl-gamma-aminobutyrate hydrolase PuuD/uncharacterized protein YjbI with pentapeptide repeats
MFRIAYDFDPTLIPQRFIQIAKENETVIVRIVNIALPLISTYQPTAKIAEITFCAFDLSALITNALNEKSFNAFMHSSHLFKIGFLVTRVTFSVVSPHAHNLCLHTYEAIFHTCLFAKALQTREFKEAAREFLHVSTNLIHLGVSVYGAPELIIASLLLQAAKEIIKSKQEFANGRYLECAANLLCAGLRLNAAIPEMQKVHRNYFGKDMTQNDLEDLLLEILIAQFEDRYYGENSGQSQLINFDHFLAKHNFKNTISGLQFNRRVKEVFFNNIIFDQMNFDKGYITGCYFKDVTFQDCILTNTRLLSSNFINSYFYSCLAKDSHWNWSSFNGCTFSSTDLTQASFNNTIFATTAFITNKLNESTFFDADVRCSVIINSELKNCLLFNSEFNIVISEPVNVTRPVIGLTFDFQSPGAFGEVIDEALKDCNGIVFKTHYKPLDIDTDLLEREVKNKLAEYEEGNPLSRAQFILDKSVENSEIGKIKNGIAKFGKHLNGVAFPGGSDIEPELYGAIPDPVTMTYPKSETDSTYLRTIFEIALMDYAHKNNLPILGICRGSQLGNVYFGGTLNQHCGEMMGAIRLLSIKQNIDKNIAQLARNIFKWDGVMTLSMHHQASEIIAKGLHVVIEYNNIPKLIMGDSVVLSQFHPEMYRIPEVGFMDFFGNNRNIFIDMIQRSTKHMHVTQMNSKIQNSR